MNICKPKSSVQNPRALLYKRYTEIVQTSIPKYAYRTNYNVYKNGILEPYYAYWVFSESTLSFSLLQVDKISDTTPPPGYQIYSLAGNEVLYYKAFYFLYNLANSDGKKNYWESRIKAIAGPYVYQSAQFSPTYKIQNNNYFCVGSFDYMLRGSVEGTTTQPLQGLIVPLSSMNIRTFNTDLSFSPDDLVVVDGRLYLIESPEIVYKRMPKKFRITFMTLNSIR